MKKSTKMLSVLLIACSLSMGAGALSGCNFLEQQSSGTQSSDLQSSDLQSSDLQSSDAQHEHTFSEEWSQDETGHWHAATCEHTDEKADFGAHVDENGDFTCDECGYDVSVPVVEYDVSFDLNGHGGANAPATVQTVEGKITAPEAPEDDNYDFGGWYANAECTGDAIDFASYKFTAETTLYAKWVERDIVAEVNCQKVFELNATLSLFNDRIKSAVVYKDGVEVESQNGEVALTEEGLYEYRITQLNDKVTVIQFWVQDKTNVVYSYDTEEERTFNFHNGGSEWLNEYQGEQGVRKATDGALRFDIGDTPFEFDYIKVRIYFEAESVTEVELGSFWVNLGKLPANQWVDWYVPRSVIQTGGSHFGHNNGGRVDTDEGFYEDVFGTVGYANQQAFQFDYLTSVSATYISCIGYGSYGKVDNSIYTFDIPENWSATIGGLNSRAWDDNYGESTWMEKFEGEQGVLKANSVQSFFTFDIGADAFTFDYINARVYFASDKASVNVYCGSNLVAENVETNKWATLKITSDMVNNASGHFMQVCGWYPVLAPSNMFDAQSWGNQVMFYFDVKDAEGNATDVTTYLSYVSYDPLTAKTVTFNTNGHGSEVASVVTSQGDRLTSDNIPADPTDDNYSFTGWYDNADCTGDPIDLTTYVFTEDTVLYARWSVKIPVIENAIYTFDTNQDWSATIGGLNSRAWDDNYGESTWMEIFEGEHGVQKANNVQSFFTFDIGADAFTFDYINVRIYFASEQSSVNVYCGSNLVAENVETNKWATIKITSDMVNNTTGHFYPGHNWYPVLAPSNMFDAASWGNQEMFYFDIKDAEGTAVDVTTYLSYVSYDPLTAKTVTFNTNGHGSEVASVETSQGDRITSDNIPADPTDDNYSFTGWYDNADCTGEAIDLATHVFAENTVLYARWIVKIPVIENAIYSFDTNVDWSTIVGGLNSRAWDDNYGESTWMEIFEGEHGVQKANVVQSFFTFDIGSEVFTFDYLNVRIYFASEQSSVNVYCGSVLVAKNVATNQWVTLKIARSKVQNENSYYYGGEGNWLIAYGYLSDEKFLSAEIAFGENSWGNQNIFHFDVKDAEGAAVDVTTYVSYISHGSYPVIENAIYAFNDEVDWSTIVGGLNSRAWDDTYGESTWMESFEGEQGVQKANVVQSYFTFDIGSEVFTFDYLNVRIYFESEKSSVNVYCGSVLVAENVATNQWVTLTINRAMVQNENSYYYGGEGNWLIAHGYLSDEKFLSGEVAFGATSWGNQDIFHFDVKDAAGAAVDVTTYVSCIGYGVNEA